MFIVLSSLLAIFFIGGAQAAACPTAYNGTCSYDVLKCCDMQFQQYLGLTNCSGAFYFEPECHQAELESLYAGGTQGLFKVCTAFNQFYQCLGPASGDCTSIGFHIANGMDIGSALQLAGIYRQYNFACGAGLDAFVNADKCMSGVFVNNATAGQISDCRNQFSNNLRAEWGERCQAYSQYNGCFSKIFRTSCGMEAGWWGCEYARQGARSSLHDCYESCSVSQKTTPQAVVQFNKKAFETPKKLM